MTESTDTPAENTADKPAYKKWRNIVEAVLLAADRPLDLEHLEAIFDEFDCPPRPILQQMLAEIGGHYADRGVELVRVAGGYRFQTREIYAPWVTRLWEERPQRYSKALLETLALIAYRQPITRGEIEDIRGVAVSTQIMKTLQEREWVRIVGHRDVPGRPAMYATTRSFLDYFNLRTLDQLPPLSEIRDLEAIGREMELKLQGEMSFETSADAEADPTDAAPMLPAAPDNTVH